MKVIRKGLAFPLITLIIEDLLGNPCSGKEEWMGVCYQGKSR